MKVIRGIKQENTAGVNIRVLRGSLKLKAYSLLLFALCLSCSTNGKEEQDDPGSWFVTVRGKVGYPSGGQITIQELKEGGAGWQDTIQLKSDNTYAKRVK